MATRVVPVVPGFPVHRFTVDQYERMIAAGILNEYDDVELLEGYIVPKMAKGDDHDTVIEHGDELIRAVLPAGCSLRCQCALALAESVPEPDFVVCTPARSRQGKHPTAGDTFLVIAVADTSVHGDRTLKGRAYARAGIPVYWTVNLEDRQVEVYTDPVSLPGADPHYRTRTHYRPGQQVPVTISGTAVGQLAVDALLP